MKHDTPPFHSYALLFGSKPRAAFRSPDRQRFCTSIDLIGLDFRYKNFDFCTVLEVTTQSQPKGTCNVIEKVPSDS